MTKKIQTINDVQELFPLLTAQEVCDLLNISDTTLYRLQVQGSLVPDFVIGRSRRYSKTRLLEQMDQNFSAIV